LIDKQWISFITNCYSHSYYCGYYSYGYKYNYYEYYWFLFNLLMYVDCGVLPGLYILYNYL